MTKRQTDKRKNNHLIYKNATQKTKDRTTRSPQKCRGDDKLLSHNVVSSTPHHE